MRFLIGAAVFGVAMLGAIEARAKDPVIPMPTCAGDADCKAKWTAAERWILNRRGAFDQQTDTFMKATMHDGNFAQVVRVPSTGDSYSIELTIGCTNVFSPCNWKKMKREFAAEVGGTTIK